MLVILSLNKYSILVIIWDMQYSMSGLSVKEDQTLYPHKKRESCHCQPHTWLLLYGKIHSGAWFSFSSEHTQTLTLHDFTYTFTSLWGATVLRINRVGLIQENHMACSFSSLPLRDNRHLKTCIFTYSNRHSFICCLFFPFKIGF